MSNGHYLTIKTSSVEVQKAAKKELGVEVEASSQRQVHGIVKTLLAHLEINLDLETDSARKEEEGLVSGSSALSRPVPFAWLLRLEGGRPEHVVAGVKKLSSCLRG